MKIADAMQDADFVQFDGTTFVAGYVRVPDETTTADDIVVEGRAGEAEIELTFDDVRDAAYIGEGVYRLRSGSLIRFLSGATLH